MTTEEILKKIPFSPPYLFVDELESVSIKGASGSYTYHEELGFFQGHFNGYPVVPGAILIETMGQIGGTCLGIFLSSLKEEQNDNEVYFATSYNVDFYKPVYPNEKVFVTSELVYVRFGKLKYNVVMKDKDDELICKGTLSGMLKKL